jgi:hypothetical protein
MHDVGYRISWQIETPSALSYGHDSRAMPSREAREDSRPMHRLVGPSALRRRHEALFVVDIARDRPRASIT